MVPQQHGRPKFSIENFKVCSEEDQSMFPPTFFDWCPKLHGWGKFPLEILKDKSGLMGWLLDSCFNMHNIGVPRVVGLYVYYAYVGFFTKGTNHYQRHVF